MILVINGHLDIKYKGYVNISFLAIVHILPPIPADIGFTSKQYHDLQLLEYTSNCCFDDKPGTPCSSW